jgi:hypothetical protein
MTGQEFAKLLGQLASLYRQCPELPVPVWGSTFGLYKSGLSKDQMQAVAKAFPRVKKSFTQDEATIQHVMYVPGTKTADREKWETPKIRLEFSCAREEVCIRKVVGTKTVPARVVPERVEPEHEEEIVEWECKPILAPEAAVAE